jgi:hypothetical protein
MEGNIILLLAYAIAPEPTVHLLRPSFADFRCLYNFGQYKAASVWPDGNISPDTF